MIALGFLFILVFLLAIVMHVLRRLEKARWLLWVLIACIPLSILAINMGWMAAEVGRQPWIVQGLHAHERRRVAARLGGPDLDDASGSSCVIYLVLFVAWLRIFLGIIKKGPEDAAEMLEAEKAGVDPIVPETTGPAPAGAGR